MTAGTAKPEEMFQAAMLFVIGQNKLVEPLYQLEKDGKLSGEGEKGMEGKAFLEDQMVEVRPNCLPTSGIPPGSRRRRTPS